MTSSAQYSTCAVVSCSIFALVCIVKAGFATAILRTDDIHSLLLLSHILN